MCAEVFGQTKDYPSDLGEGRDLRMPDQSQAGASGPKRR